MNNQNQRPKFSLKLRDGTVPVVKNNARRNKPLPSLPKKGSPMKLQHDMPTYGQQLVDVMNKGYGQTLSMYPSTLAYAKVYADPFTTEGARIPVFPVVSSALEKYYATGKGSTNPNGNGWISIAPIYFATSDAPAGYISNLTTGDAVNSGIFDTVLSSSPHPISTFFSDTGTYSVRVVALGIRVRYLGTVLNASGTCLTCQISPLGDSVSGQTYQTIKQLPGFKEYTFKDSSWHSIILQVEDLQDTVFTEYDNATSRWIFPDSNAHPFNANQRICIYMSSIPSQAFEWEVSAHYELLGTNLSRRGIQTPDTVGFEKVIGSLAERRQRDSTTKDHNVGGTWANLVGFLKHAAKASIPLVPKLLTSLLM